MGGVGCIELWLRRLERLSVCGRWHRVAYEFAGEEAFVKELGESVVRNIGPLEGGEVCEGFMEVGHGGRVRGTRLTERKDDW